MRRCLSPCDTAADVDGDGHRAMNCGGDDCDDSDANRFPGHAEVCDSSAHDEDCDPATFGVRDDDHDGSPDIRCCNTDPSGTMHCGRDCDDSSASVNPSAPEVCNGIDDNCVGGIDEGVMSAYYRDADNDMYGDPASATMMGCIRPTGYAEDNTDCDDTNASRHPGAPEVCDGIDNNCVSGVDEGLTVMTCYRDEDNDGYGLSTSAMSTCGACPSGFTNNATGFDCVDTDARVHPGQTAYDATPAVSGGTATWDFDCDGVTDLQITNTSTATDNTACGRGIGAPCGPVWLGTSTPPGCGALGSLLVCALSSTGTCGARGSATPTRQACR
jgi:hypothetical protein